MQWLSFFLLFAFPSLCPASRTGVATRRPSPHSSFLSLVIHVGAPQPPNAARVFFAAPPSKKILQGDPPPVRSRDPMSRRVRCDRTGDAHIGLGTKLETATLVSPTTSGPAPPPTTTMGASLYRVLLEKERAMQRRLGDALVARSLAARGGTTTHIAAPDPETCSPPANGRSDAQRAVDSPSGLR